MCGRVFSKDGLLLNALVLGDRGLVVGQMDIAEFAGPPGDFADGADPPLPRVAGDMVLFTGHGLTVLAGLRHSSSWDCS